MVSPFLMLPSPQCFTHLGAVVRFGDGIKVAIDICGGAHVTIEPFPDLLHWHTLGEKHRGAEVAKIGVEIVDLITRQIFDGKVEGVKNSRMRPSIYRLYWW